MFLGCGVKNVDIRVYWKWCKSIVNVDNTMVMVLYPPVGSNPKFGAQVVAISKKCHCILEHGNEVPTSLKKQWFTLKNTYMSAACTGAHQSNFQSPQNASTEELLTRSSLLHFIVEGNDTLSVNDDKQNWNCSSARHVADWSADGGDDDVSQSTDCTACTLSDDCRFWLFCHLVLSCNLCSVTLLTGSSMCVSVYVCVGVGV